MPTPISTSTPYATPGDISGRKDIRQCEDWILDTGQRATSAEFEASTKVTMALMDASGMIEIACMRGGRYTVEDLQSLVGAGRSILVKLCVELAWWNLVSRRLSGKPMAPEAMWAFSILEELEKGSRIFPLQEQADAGNPHNGFMTQSQWAELNPAIYQARRYYGRRAYQNVPGGSQNGQGCGSCGCD